MNVSQPLRDRHRRPMGGTHRALASWGSAVSSFLPVAMGFCILGPQGLAWLPALLALILIARPGFGGFGGLGPDAESLDRPLLAAFGLLVAWSAAVTLVSPQSEAGLGALAATALTVLAAGAAIALAHRMAVVRPWRWGYFAVVHGVFAGVVFVIVSGFVDLSAVGGKRLGLVWHYNRSSVMVALLSPLAMLAVAQASWRPAWRIAAAGIVGGLSAAAVFASASATAVLALIVVMATALLWRVIGRAAVWVSLAVFAVFTIAAPWLAPMLLKLAHGTPLWEFHPLTIAARLRIWAGTAADIWREPWFGHGIEHARVMGFVDPISGQRAMHNHPHSLPLQIWLELGVVGVVLLLAALACAYRLIGRQAAALPLLCVANGSLAALSVSHGVWQGWYFGLVGIVLAFTAMASARMRSP